MKLLPLIKGFKETIILSISFLCILILIMIFATAKNKIYLNDKRALAQRWKIILKLKEKEIKRKDNEIKQLTKNFNQYKTEKDQQIANLLDKIAELRKKNDVSESSKNVPTNQTASSESKNSFQDILANGENDYKNKKYDNAIANYNNAIRILNNELKNQKLSFDKDNKIKEIRIKIASSHFYIAKDLFKNRKYNQQALKEFNNAETIFKEIDNKHNLLGQIQYYTGLIHYNSNHNNDALKNFSAASNYYQLFDNENSLYGNSLYYIGRIYYKNEFYQEALEYFLMSLKLLTKYNSELLGDCYQKTGLCYWKIKNLNNAQEYFNKAIKYYMENKSYERLNNTKALLKYLDEEMKTSQNISAIQQENDYPANTENKKKNPLLVENGRTVKLHYILTVDNQRIESSIGKKPIEFKIGYKQMVPGFEKALLGMKEGENKTFEVTPEEGYGMENPELIQEFPKENLPQNIKPRVGMVLYIKSHNGQPQLIKIKEVKNKTVILNLNHLLAGKVLKFDIEIIEIK